MGSRCTGFSSCGLQALECRLSSCGTWAQLLRGMWDLPGPGLEPVCPLHWQADSQPLRHQGSPKICFYFEWSFYLIRYLLGCCSCLTVFQSSYFTSFRLILNVLWGNKGLELHSPSCCWCHSWVSYFFILPNNSLLYRYTTFFLSVPQVMDIWVGSTFYSYK